MFFRKKKPKRLYYPSKSKWYSRPRRRPAVKRSNKIFKKGIIGFLKDLAKKSLYLVVSVIIFGALLLFLLLSSYFSIADIEVVRENFNIDSAAIENELNQYIGKNILIFSRSNIQKTIQTKFPEFALVKIHKILPSTVKIELESHPIVANLKAYYILPEPEDLPEEDFTELNKAIEELSDSELGPEITIPETPLDDKKITDAIFTIGETNTKPIEQRCLLNRNGQAICNQEEKLELMTITIRSLTQPIEDREQVISKEYMDYMFEAIQQLANSMGFEVRSAEYLPIAREIHLKTTDNLIIWISIERDYKKQIDKLNTIYEAAELNKEDLSYIDLRIREKVIYCPRNARCDQ